MVEARADAEVPEARQVMECGGHEQFHVIREFEELADVEGESIRPTNEIFRLLRIGVPGEVELGPKARGRK